MAKKYANEWMEYGYNQLPTLYNKNVVNGDLETYESDAVLSLINFETQFGTLQKYIYNMF